jgi:hypothetical protein
MPFVSGLDLAQVSDFTALAVDMLTVVDHPLRKGYKAWQHSIVGLRRWQDMSYPRIVAEIAELLNVKLPNAPLAVDQTGVGRPVVDQFRGTVIAARLVPVTITSGSHAAEDTDGWKVPKKELVGVIQALLGTKRLAIAPGPLKATLATELQRFRVKITTAGNETFEAWRERDHDDLVLAVALACWYGERMPIEPEIRAGGQCLVDKAPPGVFAS